MYCFNWIHSFRTEKELKSHEKVCKNIAFCVIVNLLLKLDKKQCNIYADIESLIKKTDGYANNPEKSSATKIGEHVT